MRPIGLATKAHQSAGVTFASMLCVSPLAQGLFRFSLLKRDTTMKSNLKLISLIILICTMSVFAEDWPRWRVPDYNGISKETGFNTNWSEQSPKVLWEKSIGIGFSSIAVSNGKAYTMGIVNEWEYVYCFDAVTGEELWKHS